MRIACLLAGLWSARVARAHDWLGAVTDTSRLAEPLVYAVPCAPFPAATVPGCHPTECKRAAIDDFIAPEEVAILLGMVEKGLGEPLTAGPAIMDVNTGFVRDGRGLRNLYRSRPGKKEPRVHFTQTEYETYASVFHRIRDQIRAIFHLDTLYFTAPTFITRTGGNPEWRPADMHDEYWHPHVDRNNTPHYDYSGLIYLTTHGDDFVGGEFEFIDEVDGEPGPDDHDPRGTPAARAIEASTAYPEIAAPALGTHWVNHTILPRAGRLLVFSSGAENLHRVRPVLGGTRVVLSMWYSCDKDHEFDTFLDGAPHAAFKRARSDL